MEQPRIVLNEAEMPLNFPHEGILQSQRIHHAAKTMRERLSRVAECRGEWVDKSAEDVENALKATFPPDGENYRTCGHCLLTGAIARSIAEKLTRKNAGLQEATSANPHRYFRNDLVGNHLVQAMGLPRSFREDMQPAASYVHPERYRSME